jgi:uncharacterized damage-inducible protein DinB
MPPEPQLEQASGRASESLRMMIRYKAWADELALESVASIPLEEALKPRQTSFGNIVRTLNHIHVVDDIFRHHLEARPHSYTHRNTDETPSIVDLRDAVRSLNHWYVGRVDSWSADDLATVVDFEFIGGGRGVMTREQVVLHVVNHATYHRGFVGDMLKQIPFTWPAND